MYKFSVQLRLKNYLMFVDTGFENYDRKGIINSSQNILNITTTIKLKDCFFNQ